MKFKVTKIAAAVATGLGVSVVGMNAVQADALLFPYFAVSNTVTTLISTVNLAPPANSTLDENLHYRLYFKTGTSADITDAARATACQEFDVRRITSINDVVTFDLSGKFGDGTGVLYEPTERQHNAAYKTNATFALAKQLIPARGVLVVDNDNNTASNTDPFEGSLYGEAIILDFASGAAWGYTAYNATPTSNTAEVTTLTGNAATQPTLRTTANFPSLGYDFSDRATAASEVIAGLPVATSTTPAGLGSLPVPVVVAPVYDPNDAILKDNTIGAITRFFVTPIAHNALVQANQNSATAGNPPNSDGAWWQVPPATYQLGQGSLSTQIGLNVSAYTGAAVGAAAGLDVVYDRDETPISGQTPKTVTCVGAVDVLEMVSSGVKREWGSYGGWTAVQISSPGALTTSTGFNDLVADAFNNRPLRTNNVNQAIVQKLEYNVVGQFSGQSFANASGAYNSANWLRIPGVIHPSETGLIGSGGRAISTAKHIAASNGVTFNRGSQVSYTGRYGFTKDVAAGFPPNVMVPTAFPTVNPSQNSDSTKF